jgi:hypothetical protein
MECIDEEDARAARTKNTANQVSVIRDIGCRHCRLSMDGLFEPPAKKHELR